VDYDEAVRVCRRGVLDAAANAQGFALRAARGGSGAVSPATWSELAQIEQLLVPRLEQALRRELRVEPWPFPSTLQASLLGFWRALAPEAMIARRLYLNAASGAVDRWRTGAPQLEGVVWPFWVERTHYLANTLALALNEPAPYGVLMWHPRLREFRSKS
jgi:hypothetical protein